MTGQAVPEPEAEAGPAAESGPSGRGPVGTFLRDTAIILVGALLLCAVLKTFVVQPFSIPSASMNDTLLVGDRVLVSKLAPGPLDIHRGDIVVFADPGGWLTGQQTPETTAVQEVLIAVGIMPDPSTDHLIKRVIGLPGDRVACAGEGEPVTVNGVAIDESLYLVPAASPGAVVFDVAVPEDSIWVMGDNRANSRDSRYHQEEAGGSVPIGNVVGVAFATVWPTDRSGLLRNPGDVFAGVPDPS